MGNKNHRCSSGGISPPGPGVIALYVRAVICTASSLSRETSYTADRTGPLQQPKASLPCLPCLLACLGVATSLPTSLRTYQYRVSVPAHNRKTEAKLYPAPS